MISSLRERPILIIILGSVAGLCLCCVVAFIIFPVDLFDRLAESFDTETPVPTTIPTRTAPQVAIFTSGSGNSDVDLDGGPEPSVVHFTYSGEENFIVWGISPEGEQNALLVNTIGAYDGMVPLDFLVGEHTNRFEIESSGPWTAEILPLIEANFVTVPGSYQGIGDDAVAIYGCEPTEAMFSKESVSDFLAFAWGEPIELLIEQYVPFETTVELPSETLFLEVKAEAPWSVSLSC